MNKSFAISKVKSELLMLRNNVGVNPGQDYLSDGHFMSLLGYIRCLRDLQVITDMESSRLQNLAIDVHSLAIRDLYRAVA